MIPKWSLWPANRLLAVDSVLRISRPWLRTEYLRKPYPNSPQNNITQYERQAISLGVGGRVYILSRQKNAGFKSGVFCVL